MTGVWDYASMGLVPEGTWRNKQGRGKMIEGMEALDPVMVDILFDPQTSGGLLACVDPEDARSVEDALRAEGICGTIIGEVVSGEEKIYLV